ncbi:hypothetical protein ACIA8O_39005 [Kitasatospora sp. NPDC051853]|uniref:hypothetical protein n=1 Tax=Kitasatospora sp. NPDC051853 TaxID=3364058 RepID=UPI0037B3B032
MRSEDVEVGATYTAAIPQRLPEALRRPGATVEEFRSGMQLHLERGHRIRVTVTGFGEEPGTVTVAQPVPAGRVRLRLTAEQAAGLGLADGQEYEITGIVTDGNDEAITFPGQVVHTIPIRWLRPPGEQLELAPQTIALHRAEVCQKADGLALAEVEAAAAKALENLRRLQGLALENPDVDFGVLTAEFDHGQWLRVAGHLRGSGLDVYDPRTDPDAVEYPPLIRFRDRP